MLSALLRVIPAPLHRRLYQAAHQMRVLLWRVWKPATTGVRVLALDGQGRVLLVRHSYGSNKWMPPGGGLRKAEDPVVAGGRELREETGLLLQDARLASRGDEDLHGAPHRVNVVIGHVDGNPVPDGREIVEAAFFPVDGLPADMPAGLAASISAWLSA